MKLNPNSTKDRREAERIVAEKFGVFAPFPPAAALDRLLRWNELRSYGELLKVELKDAEQSGGPEALLKHIVREIAGRQRRMNARTVPKGYQSWEHIAAFWEACGDKIIRNNHGAPGRD
jgi:hypothetical protein